MKSAMTRLLLIATLASSLTACVSLPAKDGSPASDLSALSSEIRRALPKRTLANGKLYCVEDAYTEGQRDACALQLEDALWKSEQDKLRGVEAVDKAVRRLELARNPCGFWARLFKRRQCRVD